MREADAWRKEATRIRPLRHGKGHWMASAWGRVCVGLGIGTNRSRQPRRSGDVRAGRAIGGDMLVVARESPGTSTGHRPRYKETFQRHSGKPTCSLGSRHPRGCMRLFHKGLRGPPLLPLPLDGRDHLFYHSHLTVGTTSFWAKAQMRKLARLLIAHGGGRSTYGSFLAVSMRERVRETRRCRIRRGRCGSVRALSLGRAAVDGDCCPWRS